MGKNEIDLIPTYWASNSKYNTDYMDNIIKQKWLDILNNKEVSHD